MARKEVAQVFAVADDDGILHRVRLINIRERTGGSGDDEIVTESYFELEGGDRLMPDLGNRTFFTPYNSAMYTRVIESAANP